ncbi:MAG: Beta-lactamase [Firmicutes bacterium]|nr:Beta-lactamase [Bacillota bacterium]
MQKILLSCLMVILCLACAVAAQDSASSAPSNDAIRKILVDRLGSRQDSIGIVVGIIEPAGRRVVAYGSGDRNDVRPLDGDSVFEIGSITKVFTSLILADMAHRGEVALTDPLAKYLPGSIRRIPIFTIP